MYHGGCTTCSTQKVTLAKTKSFKKVLNAFEKAFKRLHEKEGYTAEDLKETPEYQEAITATYEILQEGIQDNVVDGELLASLEKDIFLFSNLKTHAQLLEASRLLLDENKKIKSFNQFEQEYQKINEKYNSNYLESEYLFAIGSAQQANQWAQLDSNFDLQYRTANDERVRTTHQVLHNITLPIEDSFWLQFYPPNGWRCRCVAKQVRKGKYKNIDSNEAIEKGEKATSQIGKDGKNKLEIFRFNPGQQKVVFPPKHPYHKIQGANKVKDNLNE